MKTRVWVVMCSRVTHHLFTLLPLADELFSSANLQILPARFFNLWSPLAAYEQPDSIIALTFVCVCVCVRKYACVRAGV